MTFRPIGRHPSLIGNGLKCRVNGPGLWCRRDRPGNLRRTSGLAYGSGNHLLADPFEEAFARTPPCAHVEINGLGNRISMMQSGNLQVARLRVDAVPDAKARNVEQWCMFDPKAPRKQVTPVLWQ